LTEDHAGTQSARIDYSALSALATTAVCDLWDTGLGTFAQSTIDRPDGLRPTVTFRCTEVLLSALNVAPDLLRSRTDGVAAAAATVVQTTPTKAEGRSSLKYPAYTLALLVLATAHVARLDDAVGAGARKKIDSRVHAFLKALARVGIANVHPFVQEHALRACLAARPFVSDPASVDSCVSELVDSVRTATLDLLAKHHIALTSPAESVVLAFCAAALSTTTNARDDKFALAALIAVASTQDDSGSWPLGRVVRDDPGRLEISTYEVAWVTATTLQSLLDRNACGIHDEPTSTIVDAVTRAASFATRSIVEVKTGSRGWASDHPYEQPRVESWTSAIVLQFALASAELRNDVRNREVLTTFNSVSPREDSWPEWLTWDALHERAEPDHEHPVYSYLETRVITPIRDDPRGLPSGSRECASVLLFGPPGTAKTTIVKAVAQRLDWPIVFLSPGSFIEHGLEAIEAAARSVFDRLQSLRRVVVIFDECDELFRNREPSGAPDQVRNISAFVTASMLPKLQDLHDRGHVLVFICTNHVGMMDPAVVRGGRIDHRIGVGPPDEQARIDILEDVRPGLASDIEHLGSALETLGKLSTRFSRNELQRAAKTLANQALQSPWTSEPEARSAASVVVDSMSESLTITVDQMNTFEEQQKKWSDPILLGGG
jgi:hypothetical protein